VILLGERDGGVGLVDGLGLGADDYVFKPIDPNEVAARVRAVLRRRAHHEDDRLARYEGAHISADFERVAVSVDGVSVALTLREFKLLRALLGSRNQVMSRASLLADAWGTDEWDARVVDSAMWKLRAKLGEAARQIETVTGFGYRFNEPERQPAQPHRPT
jgi:DNA-binding response OmpR family regulator